ncbi:tyrosine-type recombinase/integrase [Streptomyces albireticuli]|uniref:Site-specific integrase n=1 Tax=Streptomyces albireticuli TaxID=1940 RepID=A0A2A2D7T7_9ACTN|nr:tyrosine-type recombinase/integrase [Streptomyces albireticuli]MCD9194260.1 tyrosine-type recombinase/integrase [Streptomyces albireticuli]PAU47382.1 site-specific integrase [Streptomyces albireticuli]
MAGYIEDRWLTKRPDPETGKRRRTSRYGQGMRWRVAGIPGVRDRSFELLDDAKTWKAKTLTDMKRQEFIDERDGVISVREYVETVWWPTRRDPVGTAKAMKTKIWNHLLPNIGHHSMNTIDREHLEALVARWRDCGLADSTAEVVWMHGSSIFKSAVGKRVARNPFSQHRDLKPKPAPSKARAWLPEEVHAIQAGLAERYRITVDLGVAAGFRQGERLGFDPADIDEKRALLLVRRQLLWDPSKPYFKLPKGRKEREVPLSPGLLKRLLEHTAKYPPVKVTLPWHGPGNGGRPTVTVNLMISTHFGNPVNASQFNRRSLKPALAAAGIIASVSEDGGCGGWEPSRDAMSHRDRHTYASVQLAAGEDVVSVSHWMGHSSPLVTVRTYAHFMPDKGRRGRIAIDAWLSQSQC